MLPYLGFTISLPRDSRGSKTVQDMVVKNSQTAPIIHFPSASALVAELGGSYAAQLGIHLHALDPAEIYKWFLAALLYGARISETIAGRTWQVFRHHDILTPERVIDAGWERLVALLDEGGYVRYDYKTATKLLAVNQSLLDQYAGNLNDLHATAADACDLEQRVMSLGKGIGCVTTHIFLRELRGRWEKAAPPLAALALNAAQELGFVPEALKNDPQQILIHLQQVWCKNGESMESFADFEAALVRYGLRLRHLEKKNKRANR